MHLGKKRDGGVNLVLFWSCFILCSFYDCNQNSFLIGRETVLILMFVAADCRKALLFLHDNNLPFGIVTTWGCFSGMSTSSVAEISSFSIFLYGIMNCSLANIHLSAYFTFSVSFLT